MSVLQNELAYYARILNICFILKRLVSNILTGQHFMWMIIRHGNKNCDQKSVRINLDFFNTLVNTQSLEFMWYLQNMRLIFKRIFML